MVSQCISVNMQQPTTITIVSITPQGIVCGQCAGPSCPTPCNVQCPGATCPSNISVVITWSNTGDFPGTFTPTISIDAGTPVPAASPVTVPANNLATTNSFTVNLSRGLHNLCVDSGLIT